MTPKYPDHPSYIPVIKWQQYEQHALRNLSQDVLEKTTPCIEIRDSSQHTNILKNYASVIGRNRTLIDYSDPLGFLSGVRLNEFRTFLSAAQQNALSVVPTISPFDLNRLGANDLNLLLKFGEIAVRARTSSFDLGSSQMNELKTAISTLRSKKCQAKVLLDLGETPETWNSSECKSLATSIDLIAAEQIYSIHLLSGAYPESLASVKTGMAEFKRRDWILWQDVNKAAQSPVGFGDYGILNPNWTEEILTMRGNRVAIRYTRENDWLILRADGKTRDDSIAISTILVNVYHADFKGGSYSFGDELLEKRADPTLPPTEKKCGHYHITEGWSHHITYVVREQY